MSGSNGSNDEARWTDDRILAAYDGLAGGKPAPDVATAIRRATDADQPKPPMRVLLRLGRSMRVATGLAATVAIVCLVGAAAILRFNQTTTSGSPSPSTPPRTAMTVSQLLTALEAKDLTTTDLFTVEGWLAAATPPIPCPTFTIENEFGQDFCGKDATLTISEKPDGTASKNVIVPSWVSLPQAVMTRSDKPAPVVLIGHVHDARASLCSETARAGCEAAFVLDDVVSFDGRSFGPSVGAFTGEHPTTPTMSAETVLRALANDIPAGSTVVSLTAVVMVDESSYWPGLTAPGYGEGDGPVRWYVRLIGYPPLAFPMPGAHLGSGVLVYSESGPTGFRGAAGWGWDPRRPGVQMADGTVSIMTTNWLPGPGCAGVGTDAVLRGSPDDPRIVWLDFPRIPGDVTPDPAAKQPTVSWPAGYRARFTPKLEIVDGSGNVVIREGDGIQGACGYDPDTGAMYLEPPFN